MTDRTHRDGPTQSGLQELIDKLKAVQRACAQRDPEERVKAIRKTLSEELARVPMSAAAERLDDLKAYLDGRDPEAARKLAGLEAEVRRLRGEVDSLRGERDRLLREQSNLEPSPATLASSDDALERIRAALLKVAENRKVTTEETGLAPAQVPLFQTLSELLRFALALEVGLQGFLRTSEVGDVGMMGTRQFAEHERMIRSRFRSSLQDRDGSAPPLKEALDKNLRFLLVLHQAYGASIDAGTRALLALVDPQKILEDTRGRLGVNYQEAWKRLSRLLAELGALEKGEVWERYFEEPFRKRLKDVLPEGRSGDDS
jgi:hypothetical protein